MSSILIRRIMSHHQRDMVARVVLSSVGTLRTQVPQPMELARVSVSIRDLHCTRSSAQAASTSAVDGKTPKSSPEETGTGQQAGGSGEEESGRTAGIMLFCSLVGLTAALGTWQTQRYRWKVKMVEDRKGRIALEPVDLPVGSLGAALAKAMDDKDRCGRGPGVKGENDSDGMGLLAELEGRRVRVTGVFDHGREVLVGPRGAPPGLTPSSGSSSTVGSGSAMAPSPMGDYVYTPLKLRDGSIVIFNRGWAPRKGGSGWSRPEGEVTVVGVLKAAEKRGTFSPVNDPASRRLLWLEKESLVKAAGLEDGDGGESSPPILMEAVGPDEEDAQAEVPMAKRAHHFGEFHVMPVTHMMYAATWYSLAAAASVLTWVRFRRKGPAVIKAKPPVV